MASGVAVYQYSLDGCTICCQPRKHCYAAYMWAWIHRSLTTYVQLLLFIFYKYIINLSPMCSVKFWCDIRRRPSLFVLYSSNYVNICQRLIYHSCVEAVTSVCIFVIGCTYIFIEWLAVNIHERESVCVLECRFWVADGSGCEYSWVWECLHAGM